MFQEAILIFLHQIMTRAMISYAVTNIISHNLIQILNVKFI